MRAEVEQGLSTEDCTQGEGEEALSPQHGSGASVLTLSQLAAEVAAVARGMSTDRHHCMAYTRSTASLRQWSGFKTALKCLWIVAFPYTAPTELKGFLSFWCFRRPGNLLHQSGLFPQSIIRMPRSY